jgi:hemerythrin-like domain-containing protein
MRPEVIGPLIAAIAAVAVMAIQLFAGRKTTRELEILKDRLTRQQHSESEHLKLYLQRYAEGQDQNIEAFRRYLAAVQELKDRCRRVIDSPRSFAPKILAAELSDLTASISRELGIAQIHMSQEDYALAHQLKHHLYELADFTSELHEIKVAGPHQTVPNALAYLVEKFERKRTQVDSDQGELRRRARDAAASYVRSIEEQHERIP